MPRQSRHLDLISQFSNDIWNLAGEQNVVADALSRIESVEFKINYATLMANQENNAELKALQAKGTSLQFEKVKILGTNAVKVDFHENSRCRINLPSIFHSFREF